MTGSFLTEPPVSPRVQTLYDEDLADDGYISTTPSAPSPTRNSPRLCPSRCARP